MCCVRSIVWVAASLLVLPMHVRAQRVDSTSAESRLVKTVCERQIVVLGELPSHGEGRTFQAKASIVRRLVEECGFNALLFESPIYDFLGLQDAITKGQATLSQLDRAIGRFWLTRELSDWRQWLFQQTTNGALVLAAWMIR